MTYRILIVGAGINGVSTALWLNRFGHDVTLMDPHLPGTGASFGNAGLIAQWALVPVTEPGLIRKIPKYLLSQYTPLFLKWRYLPTLAPWLVKFLSHANETGAKAASDGLAPILSDAVEQHKALAAGTSAQDWIADSAFGYAYKTYSDFQHDAYGWAIKQAHGLSPEILTNDTVQEAEPALGPGIKCLAVLKGQGHILNPHGYINALYQAFIKEGGRFIQTAVQDFLFENKRIKTVVTDQGTFDCDKLVLTAGIWSKPLMGKLGLNVPLETERGYHVVYKNPSLVPKHPMMMTVGKFAVTPMSDGLRCAGTVEFGGIKLGPSSGPVKLIRKRVAQYFPHMTYEDTEEWMGFRPSTPDSLPLIGELGSTGVFTGFGHQHVGLTAGPKTGRLIAGLIEGQLPNIDLSPYAPERYRRS